MSTDKKLRTPDIKEGELKDCMHFKGVMEEYDDQRSLNLAIEEFLDKRQSELSQHYDTDEQYFIKQYNPVDGHYMSFDAAKELWRAAWNHGYNYGKVIEPNSGIGTLFRLAPSHVWIIGYEHNEFSYKICRILYPEISMSPCYFSDVFICNDTGESIKNDTGDLKKVDLCIGTPAPGIPPEAEQKYTQVRNNTEYYITRGLDLLKPEGLLVYLVDKKDSKYLLQTSKKSHFRWGIIKKATVLEIVDLNESQQIIVLKKL